MGAISRQKPIRFGLFELDANDDTMPIDANSKATQFDVDGAGDVMPEDDIEPERDDDEFELDGSGDIMPRE
jgi:hypothetical protein